MKIRSLLLFVVIGLAPGKPSALAQTVAKKTSSPRPVQKTQPKAAPAKSAPKTASKSAVTAAKKPATPVKAPANAARASKTVKGKPPVKRAGFQPRQTSPTPDRLKEIQGALASKGYLKSEPSGVWDAESVDAMKRYQADQKLDPSGKITAASLIGLGLGSSTAAPLSPPAATPAVTAPPAATTPPRVP